jgi:hypothetical protein
MQHVGGEAPVGPGEPLGGPPLAALLDGIFDLVVERLVGDQELLAVGALGSPLS